jgi:DNA end-binding protein Ku
MAARSVWKGFIKFSLVAVPVKAYTAANSSGSGVALNQLHKGCNARIKYQKVCPVHGEIPASDIVSGYEFAENQYVTIDPDELAALRTKSERSVNVEHFVDAGEVDARYLSGRTLYLVPDGVVGGKPYALLHKLMVEEGKVAFATGVFSNKEQTLLIRPVGRLLAASFLSFASELKSPAEFEPEVPEIALDEKEVALARTLVSQYGGEDFDFAKYTDQYAENLAKLVQAKVEGKQVVAPPAEEEPQVINLMEALQKSLDAAKAKAKPPKLVAPSTASAAAAAPAAGKKSKAAPADAAAPAKAAGKKRKVS